MPDMASCMQGGGVAARVGVGMIIVVDWGVSEQVQASPKPITFWEHQCVLIDHDIFTKQIGSIVLILNHSKFNFFRTFLYFCGFLEFFMSETLFLDFP